MKYPAYQASLIPKAFLWRRIHSLTGLWLVLFLIEHLFTNSQAALWMGEGNAFVRSVNFLQNLPYLPLIEIVLLGVPFLIHGLWGIHYLMEAKRNSGLSDGSVPSLPYYARNHAYTWQRWTSWIILVGVIAHVIQMRFLEYPSSIQLGNEKFYISRIKNTTDPRTLSTYHAVKFYEQENLSYLKESVDSADWATVEKWPLQENQLLAVSPSFGTAVLFMVRDTFQSATMVFLYTIFVMVTTFHAFNGLWTSMITWGITLTAKSQALMRKFAIGLMVIVAFFGFAAIWSIYLESVFKI